LFYAWVKCSCIIGQSTALDTGAGPNRATNRSRDNHVQQEGSPARVLRESQEEN
jgi:hypothetical protein